MVYCDCHGENDAPILPDVGIFASFDPVALDQACVDACLHATPMPNSQLFDNLADPHWHHHQDNFLDSNPNVRWKETLEHAEKIDLGTREYELIQMKRRIEITQFFFSFVCLRYCVGEQ